jgi:hypothetical protein
MRPFFEKKIYTLIGNYFKQFWKKRPPQGTTFQSTRKIAILFFQDYGTVRMISTILPDHYIFNRNFFNMTAQYCGRFEKLAKKIKIQISY